MRRFILSSVLFLIFGLTANVLGQGRIIGKEFSIREANELFGMPKQTVSVDVETFRNLINQCGEYVYFTIKNGKFYVAKKYGQFLNNDGAMKDGEPMSKISTSVLKHLIRGKSDGIGLKSMSVASTSDVLIELRPSTTTITYDGTTADMIATCPPDCWP